MMYCLVEESVVTRGPVPLPQNWENISNLPLLSDPELLALGWYPANVTTPAYDPYYSYLAGYTFVINATDVDATRVVVAKDPVPLPAPEGVAKADALDVVTQAEQIWLHDNSRRDVGAPPVIDDGVKSIWDDWLRDSYVAMDNGTDLPEPPAEIRRAIDMPDQEDGLCVISWFEFTGQWPGWGFKAEFERDDVSNLGLKVYDENLTYLYALTFEASGELNRWVTETPAGFATVNQDDRSFEIIAGSLPVTELITLDNTVDYRSFVVKWSTP